MEHFVRETFLSGRKWVDTDSMPIEFTRLSATLAGQGSSFLETVWSAALKLNL